MKQYPAEFMQFWTAYPRKDGKAQAFRIWERAIIDGADPAWITHLAGCFARYMRHEGRPIDKIPHPSTFLSQRLDDDPTEWPGCAMDATIAEARRRAAEVEAARLAEQQAAHEQAKADLARIATLSDDELAGLVERVMARRDLSKWELTHLRRTKALARENATWRMRLIEVLDGDASAQLRLAL